MKKIEKIELHTYTSGDWIDDAGEPDWESSAANISDLWHTEVLKMFPESEIESEWHDGKGGTPVSPHVKIYYRDSVECSTESLHNNQMTAILERFRDIFQNRAEEWYCN